jgi:hypothetical protein
MLVIAEKVPSLVKRGFPTFADLEMKRKMMREHRHTSRVETIAGREHSIYS